MRRMMYVQAVNQALREELARDPGVFVLGEDITVLGGPFKTTDNLYKEFPGRVINSPISEAGLVGVGLGAALTGLRPVIEIMFSDFMGIAMDQLFNQAAKAKYMFGGNIKVPLTVKTQQGGYTSSGPQHSSCLEAWIAHTPGLKVAMPSCPADMYGLMKTAIRDDNPVVVFEHKAMYNLKGDVPDGEYTIPFGCADIKREGGDVTIIATSYMVTLALQAAGQLEKDGISAEVVDPRTLVPLDKQTIISSVKKTGRAVIVYEANKTCGWGAEMAAIIAEEAFGSLNAPIARVAALQCPVPYSRPLELAMLPSAERIASAVKSALRPPRAG